MNSERSRIEILGLNNLDLAQLQEELQHLGLILRSPTRGWSAITRPSRPLRRTCHKDGDPASDAGRLERDFHLAEQEEQWRIL